MKKSFEQMMEETRTNTASITCWCILIALHQEFGIGAGRLNRIQAELDRIQQAYSERLAAENAASADNWLNEQVEGKTWKEFRVPVLRAPKNRKERQLRMAGDEAAATAWKMYSAACIRVLGYGTNRLAKLHAELWNNYSQVNEWARDGGMEYAYEKVRLCAQDALKEQLRIVDDDPEGWEEYKSDFRKSRKLADRVKLSGKLAQPGISHTEDEKGAIFAKCMAETLGSMHGIRR